MKNILFIFIVILYSSILTSQEIIDYKAIEKIKNEGLKNSKIEEIAFQIIDLSGPRLSNSPGYNRAANLAVSQLKEWGLENAVLEPWGEFGKGWELNKSYIAMTKPYYLPFIAIPKAWTSSSNGLINGKVKFLDISSETDFEKYKGKLKGAIILLKPDSLMIGIQGGNPQPNFKADAIRFTEEELKEKEIATLAPSRFTPEQITKLRANRKLNQKISTFLADEGVAMIVRGTSGRHGTLFTSSNRSGYLKDSPKGICEIDLAPEHFNLMLRLVENKVDVEIEAEVKTTFYEDDLKGYNVIAEIPGSDKKLKSELVMLGGHLDSWHGATGATDNAAGCIVMMEAVRILKATGLQPKRTIRIALWGSEEQGIHGSRNYVKNHFGDPKTKIIKPEHEKISAYYNIDNGTGRIRGIYLQGNEAVGSIFKQWFVPFEDMMDRTTLTITDTGGTDHLAFDAIGIPGFQFIQDQIEYRSRTHHTNMDTYERLVIDDLKQMAVIVASFVYHTAQRDEKLPREQMEEYKAE